MFKFEEICELIRLVGSSGVASVEVEHGGSRLRIEGVAHGAPIEGTPRAVPLETVPVARMATTAPAVAAPPQAPEAMPAAGEEEGVHFVTSPIVGTFYRAPNPDADPYVKVGDFVEKGQVLCIVEAMKLMNEIESDTSGTVVKVYAENAQPVEFGERLFALRPA
jgi:acetyl-CoA carboxylase biotin carboxyl carrier protein